jgi:ubiquitin C-terminal hydrolase
MSEPFLDLSVDLEENTSINYCIKKLEHSEQLKGQNKFQCDSCKLLQEAEKR